MAGGVPEGDFEVLVVEFDQFGEELHPDGCLLAVEELVFDVPGRQVGLAGARVADHHNFEHVAFVIHCSDFL